MSAPGLDEPDWRSHPAVGAGADPAPPGVPERFWRRFTSSVLPLPGGCALWLRPPRDDGYGQFWVPNSMHHQLGEPDAGEEQSEPGDPLFTAPATTELLSGLVEPDGHVWRASRVAFAVWYGPIDSHTWVQHRCDTPLCTPITRAGVDAHLQAGDHISNALDRDRKGRGVQRSRSGGVHWGLSDRRGPARRAAELHAAVTMALARGDTVDDIVELVRDVEAAGAPNPGQLTVPDPVPVVVPVMPRRGRKRAAAVADGQLSLF